MRTDPEVPGLVYENAAAWIRADAKKRLYTVFRSGLTHSTSDSAYPMTGDGLSVAVKRAEYIAICKAGPMPIAKARG